MENTKLEEIEKSLIELSKSYLVLGEGNGEPQEINMAVSKLYFQFENNMKKIIQLKQTGEFGLAILSIMRNNYYRHPDNVNVLALLSYWAITNHLQNIDSERHIFLYNRGLLMDGYIQYLIDVFKEFLYKQYQSNGTITDSVNLSAYRENYINMLVTDFYQVQDIDDSYEVLANKNNFEFEQYKLSHSIEFHNSFSKYISDFLVEIYN
jgi:hypothetical protein